jgi:hypothetical protein
VLKEGNKARALVSSAAPYVAKDVGVAINVAKKDAKKVEKVADQGMHYVTQDTKVVVHGVEKGAEKAVHTISNAGKTVAHVLSSW